ncbi:MAG: hypothetical protein OXH52_13000 [Gammaproteobacteria bacterium]|nr:hypothetical protein [Gammaproteobacteria bacterium]
MDTIKRLLSSLPVILTLATIGALALMYILVDDPKEKAALLDQAAVGLESRAPTFLSARS